jgi:hypothetical protein
MRPPRRWARNQRGRAASTVGLRQRRAREAKRRSRRRRARRAGSPWRSKFIRQIKRKRVHSLPAGQADGGTLAAYFGSLGSFFAPLVAFLPPGISLGSGLAPGLGLCNERVTGTSGCGARPGRPPGTCFGPDGASSSPSRTPGRPPGWRCAKRSRGGDRAEGTGAAGGGSEAELDAVCATAPALRHANNRARRMSSSQARGHLTIFTCDGISAVGRRVMLLASIAPSTN